MAARHVLVKELRSVETLGSMTVLATDKTGTLTQNKMELVGGWLGEVVLNSAENVAEMESKALVQTFAEVCTLCNSCKLDATERGKPIADRSIFGDATEVGLLHFTGQYFFPRDQLDEFMEKYPKVHEIPFNSANKWHLTAHRRGPGKLTMYLKGAPERVLGFCERYYSGTGFENIDQGFREEFLRIYEYFASKGLRILSLATKEIPDTDEINEQWDPERMDFIGFACLRDPPKPGVDWAVARCKTAGVKVIMVTGDHPLTAEAIARQVGILTKSDVFKRPPSQSDLEQYPDTKAAVIHGDAIDSMSKGEWTRLVSMNELVFARF